MRAGFYPGAGRSRPDMPWHVGKSAKCPGSKPFAVIKDSDGSVAGCHATQADAKKQLAALYAQEANKGAVMADLERRYTSVPVEVRARDTGQKIGGYAAVFNRYSQNLGGFVERGDPAMFNKSRADGWPDVLARYNHDDNMLLGTTGGGTLSLEVDGTGLLYEVVPPAARADIVELVSRGDVRKSSFAFRVFEEDWGLTEQDFPLRTLLSVQLVDVAPVNMPAYLDTTSGLRSLAAFKQVPIDEVRSLAEANDLRKLFMRKDKQGKPVQKVKTMFGPAAAMAMRGRKEDPWV